MLWKQTTKLQSRRTPHITVIILSIQSSIIKNLSSVPLEKIYKLRNDKLESLGLNEKGIPFIESESKGSIIFNMYKLICDVNAPLPILL